MHRRLLGLARDAWYLLVLIAVAAVVFWFVLAPVAAGAMVVLALVVFTYFALMRYDDEGRERSDIR